MIRALVILCVACGSPPPAATPAPPRAVLYDKLGGMDKIDAIADEVLVDPNDREQLAAKLCEVSGGPCKHERTIELDAQQIELLRAALAKHGQGVGARDREDLVEKVVTQ